jgi:hypothetical protein
MCGSAARFLNKAIVFFTRNPMDRHFALAFTTEFCEITVPTAPNPRKGTVTGPGAHKASGFFTGARSEHKVKLLLRSTHSGF